MPSYGQKTILKTSKFDAEITSKSLTISRLSLRLIVRDKSNMEIGL